MSIVEHGDEGAFGVPDDFLAGAKPNGGYVLDVHDGLTVLRPVDESELVWKNPDPMQRAEAIRRWAESPRPPAPDIPLELLDREHIYD